MGRNRNPFSRAVRAQLLIPSRREGIDKAHLPGPLQEFDIATNFNPL
ncbi:MAG TPA: hypothetical protein VGK65_20415 [Candidatus Binatia bacterium]|jgi:hypothetical protein